MASRNSSRFSPLLRETPVPPGQRRRVVAAMGRQRPGEPAVRCGVPAPQPRDGVESSLRLIEVTLAREDATAISLPVPRYLVNSVGARPVK